MSFGEQPEGPPGSTPDSMSVGAAPASTGSSPRTYRVEVAGQFDHPAGDVRQALLDGQPDHDRTEAAFTPEGTLTYAPSLTRFMFRYLIEVAEESAVDADAMAVLTAESRSQEYLKARGIQVKATKTTATCLEDVKLRRSSPKRPHDTSH
jgi:Family of unknown function (DUF6204)